MGTKTLLLLVESKIEDAMAEVSDRLQEETNPLTRANLEGRLLGYKRSLECVREVRETLA